MVSSHCRSLAPSRCVLVALLAAAPLTIAAPAAAQQSAVIDEVTVTATRAPRPIEEVPQTVQVIERQEIERQLQTSPSAAAALARLVPGYSPSTQTVSSASETFRGRSLLVMVDGVPLNTPLRDVSRILGLIDLNAVERIEVVAGASSLYGAGATGGTVNFITRRPTEGPPQVSVHTAVRAFTHNVGNSLAPEVSATVSGGLQGFDYTVVGTGRWANRTYDGEGRELPSDPMLGQGGSDRFASGNLFARLGYSFDPARRIEVQAIQLYFNQTPDYLTDYTRPFARPNFAQPYTGQSVLEDTRAFQLRYTDREFALGGLSLVGFYNDIQKRFNFTTFSPVNNQVYYSGNPLSPTSPFNQTVVNSERFGANLTIDTPLDAIWRGARLTWGADVIRENTSQELTDGRQVFTPLGQTTLAGFGLLQVPLTDRLTVRGGVRYEHFDLTVDPYLRPTVYAAANAAATSVLLLPALNVTGGNFTYDAPTFNLGATFRVTDAVELYGGFSQGFALPDVGAFTRRAGSLTTADALAHACPVANPNCLPLSRRTVDFSSLGIQAQLVNNYEVGIRGRFGNVRTMLAGFVSTSNEGVTFDPASNTLSQQREVIYGVEFIGEVALTDALTVGTNLAFREGRYDSNRDGRIDSFLPNNRIATPARGTIYGNYRFDNGVAVRVEAEGFVERDVRTDLAGTRNPIDGGFTMNASVTVPWQGGDVYIAGSNLFDVGYENPTATATRNLPVYALGRTVTVGYRRTF